MVNSKYSPPGNTNYNNLNNEIKSHSSVLFNERIHVLLYILETESIDIHTNPKLKSILNVKSTLFQLWKIVRTLVFNDPDCRRILNLEVEKMPGIYTPDIGFNQFDKYYKAIMNDEGLATYENILTMVNELDEIELILRNILQFYKYFIRFDKSQKPDIDKASQRYISMIDERTKNELQEVMGKRAKFNLDNPNELIDEEFFDEDED